MLWPDRATRSYQNIKRGMTLAEAVKIFGWQPDRHYADNRPAEVMHPDDRPPGSPTRQVEGWGQQRGPAAEWICGNSSLVVFFDDLYLGQVVGAELTSYKRESIRAKFRRWFRL
jgi:hypothetical protein